MCFSTDGSFTVVHEISAWKQT